MAVTIKVERFSGPLDLLLELIHNKELEVNEVSLKEVTDQFIQYLDKDYIPADELTDFLTIAVKLVLLKLAPFYPTLKQKTKKQRI